MSPFSCFFRPVSLLPLPPRCSYGIVPLTDALVRSLECGAGEKSKIREYRFGMEHASEFFNLSMGLLRSGNLSRSLPPFPCCFSVSVLFPLYSHTFFPRSRSLSAMAAFLSFLSILQTPLESSSHFNPSCDRSAACLSIYLHIFVIFRDVNPWAGLRSPRFTPTSAN